MVVDAFTNSVIAYPLTEADLAAWY